MWLRLRNAALTTDENAALTTDEAPLLFLMIEYLHSSLPRLGSCIISTRTSSIRDY